MKCANCEHYFWSNEPVFHSKYGYHCYICQNCAEKELETHMPNIKITAEVDGKQVPLQTISTESFEAIKALEKPKEITIPVARLANWEGCSNKPRLLLRITDSLKYNITTENPYMVAIDLKSGDVTADWFNERDVIRYSDQYENVKPL